MPTQHYSMRRERLAIMRMIVAIMFEHRESYFGSMKLTRGDDDTTVLVALAVAIGHAENRPMTATKVSHFTHISLTTAQRKLARLVELGVILRKGDHFLQPKERAMMTLKHYERRVKRYTDIVNTLCAVFTSSPVMGGKNVDRISTQP